MSNIELSDAEWQQVLGILSMAPWRDANPLLMKIGEQLRVAQGIAAKPDRMQGNSSAMGDALKQ